MCFRVITSWRLQGRYHVTLFDWNIKRCSSKVALSCEQWKITSWTSCNLLIVIILHLDSIRSAWVLWISDSIYAISRKFLSLHEANCVLCLKILKSGTIAETTNLEFAGKDGFPCWIIESKLTVSVLLAVRLKITTVNKLTVGLGMFQKLLSQVNGSTHWFWEEIFQGKHALGVGFYKIHCSEGRGDTTPDDRLRSVVRSVFLFMDKSALL